MNRFITLALALFFFVPCVALAQAPAAHHGARDPEIHLSLDPELASIDAESRTATALYATALSLHIGGLAVGVIGSIAGFCIFECTDAQHTARDVGIAGFIAAGVGLLVLIPAILVDVDSGRRRTRHAQGHVAVSIGAGGIGVEGTF